MNFENFLKEFNISDKSLKQLKDYFLFKDEDRKVLKDFKEKIKSIPEEIFDNFYNHLLSSPEIKEILTKEEGFIEHLKKCQKEHLEYILTTDINMEYVKKAFNIGIKHFKNGVKIDYYQGAYLKYIDSILKYYEDKFTPEELAKFRKSFLKLIFIDMNFAIKTYYYLLNRKLEEEKKKYETIFESSFDGIIIVDEKGNILDTNHKIEELTGLKKDEVLFKDFTILVPEGDRKYVKTLFKKDLESSESYNLYYDLYLYNYKNKRKIPVEIAISKTVLDGKSIIIATIRNIEDILEKERKIANLSRLYKILYETNALLTRVFDLDVLFEDIIKILSEEGRFENIIFLKVENGDVKVIKSYKDISFSNQQINGILYSIKEKHPIKFDGDFSISIPILLDQYILTTTDLKNEKYALVLQSSDIKYLSEEEKNLLKQIVYDIAFGIYSIKKKEEIRYLSYYDVITDLPNRRFLIERLESAIEEAKNKDENVAVFIIDIDRFKNINDAFGFGVGDIILKIIAKRIKKVLRGRDIIARFGNDEFGIVAFGIKNEHDVIKLLNRIRDTVKSPVQIDSKTIFITLSIGIALFPQDGSSLSEVLGAVNAALREAKAKGGNEFIFYNPNLKKITVEAIELEVDLRKAIRKNQFILYFQPIINLKTMEIEGAEALIRWKHTKKGVVPPFKFIPVLEDTNMILEVGEWVIEEAIKQSLKWEKYNVHIVVSLNVSAKQMIKRSISEMIKRKLAEFGGNPKNIIVELTETTLMENLELIKDEIEKLHKIGVRVEIDDFGTGYSSLAYLKKLPVYALKIDREFIKDMTENEDDKVIVKAIINLAHVLGKKTVAEGIETKEHLNFLIENECDYGQGYLFSPPVPAEEFENIYNEFKNKWKK